MSVTRKLLTLLGVGCVASLASVASASALTLHVTNNSSTGPGSLDNALSQVSSSNDASSVILIDDLGPHAVIDLPQQAFIPHSVAIKGPGVDRLTIDLDQYGFLVQGDLTLKRMTLTGANESPQVLSSAAAADPLIARGENVTLDHVTVRDNHAHQRVHGSGSDDDVYYDAGMFRASGTLLLDHTHIVDNSLDVAVTTTTRDAYILGGIVEGSEQLTIEHSEISHNQVSLATAPGDSQASAHVRPGLLDPFGPTDISDSSISGNVLKAKSDGRADVQSAIFFSDDATITSSTIADNAAKAVAPDASTDGAILAIFWLTVENSTISGNQGESFGNLEAGSTPPTISSSIIADPKGGPNCMGDFVSQGFNLDSDGSCGLSTSTDVRRGKAGLRPLGDHGGSTETVALSPNSPAVDAGQANGLASDQREFARTVDTSLGNAADSDGTDIGAFELRTIPSCASKRPTIASHPGSETQGTNQADVILGTTGSDLISGAGGRDVICGRGGIDALTGGAGADVIHGGDGRDLIGGIAGDDELFGGRGNDGLFGFSGQDRLLGGNGDDRLGGGSGKDRCQGGKGRDKRLSCER